METPPPLVNRKWFLFVLASFLGFAFLASCINQGWRPSSIFASLRDPEASTPENPIPDTVTQLPESGAASVQLSAQQGVEEKFLLPPPNPGAEEKESSNVNVELSPQPPSIEASPPQSTVEDRAPPTPSKIEKSPQPTAIEASPPQLTVEDRAPPTPSKIETSPQATAIEMVSAGSSATQVNTTSDDGGDGAAAEPGKCDVFVGRWVYDPKAYPLYQARRCHFLSDQVSCRKNGRPDSGYEHWRWEARDCEIPRFNRTLMLEKMRGKRIVIVGDSLNRNQFESLACLIYTSVKPKRTYFKLLSDVYKIFKSLDYDLTVEFYWSPFLVPLEGAEGEPKVLKLDRLPATTRQWMGADVMVFNTGHWWTHRGHLKKWDYFEHRGKLVETMEGDTAFKMSLRTWARWVDRWVDPDKTTVFFRSISPEHKRESNHWCYNQWSPITNETNYKQFFPSSMTGVVERTIQKMRTPVKYLDVTRLSEYRRDAHTGVYTTRAMKPLTPEERAQPAAFADCSHWCVPGLPDTWNLLIFTFIIGNPSIVL